MSSPRSRAASDPRRHLAPVHELLARADVIELSRRYSHSLVTETLQSVLASFRSELSPGDPNPRSSDIIDRLRRRLETLETDRLRRVVNATGVILHTGLGRAVLPGRVARALAALDGCCNMQVDLRTGQRGQRNAMTERLLTRLTGAEAALVVNNNAAATFLILTALCRGQDVIVSRGQLIEIGGSFRLPDCIHQSGARLIEVGTTNRTHLRDYRAALTESTGAVLRCRPSNFRVVGFTREVSIAELDTLRRDRPFILVDDLGCGALVDLASYSLPSEPTVQQSLLAGADLVCFSGDKLIGGPQSGIIVGRESLGARIRPHPMTRMLRVDKLTDLALQETLRLFLEPETLAATNPTHAMLAITIERLEERARTLEHRLRDAGISLDLDVCPGQSETGGGTLPDHPIPTWVLTVGSAAMPTERISRLLREGEPPVIARIAGGRVVIDMRTLLDGDDEIIFQALCRINGVAAP